MSGIPGLFLRDEKTSLQKGDLVVFEFELGHMSVFRGNEPIHFVDHMPGTRDTKLQLGPIKVPADVVTIMNLISVLTGLNFEPVKRGGFHTDWREGGRHMFWKAF